MNSYLQRFLRYLKIEKNLSINTLSAYEYDLNRFIDFQNPDSERYDPEQISSPEREVRDKLPQWIVDILGCPVNNKDVGTCCGRGKNRPYGLRV